MPVIDEVQGSEFEIVHMDDQSLVGVDIGRSDRFVDLGVRLQVSRVEWNVWKAVRDEVSLSAGFCMISACVKHSVIGSLCR
jgi:hypothetical protein